MSESVFYILYRGLPALCAFLGAGPGGRRARRAAGRGDARGAEPRAERPLEPLARPASRKPVICVPSTLVVALVFYLE